MQSVKRWFQKRRKRIVEFVVEKGKQGVVPASPGFSDRYADDWAPAVVESFPSVQELPTSYQNHCRVDDGYTNSCDTSSSSSDCGSSGDSGGSCGSD